MLNDKKKNYSIGLDIGTSSVGWAVIDCNNYKVLRKGNRKLWGVRLFDEATTAEARRIARGTRRRYDRRRARIKLLQEEFQNEINKVDTNFLKKLKESAYHEDDKLNKTIILSQEEKTKIKKYNDLYPTIYHLRHKLISSNEKMDIRLVYLAIHHIIKYRGNFLYGASDFNTSNLNIEELFENMLKDINDISNIEKIGVLTLINSKNLEEFLSLESKNDKKLELTKELSQAISKKQTSELVKLLIGDKSNLNILFNIDADEEIKISFKGSEYEDNEDKIIKNFPNEIEFLEDIKSIYNAQFLLNIFKGKKEHSLSYVMVDNYNIHHNDLQNLKAIYKENKSLYKKMFKNENCTYEKYITNNITYDDFKKEIIKDLDLLNSVNKLELLEKLETENFMPRITSVDNGKYPYQLNKSELIKIIENQGQYYPFLLDKTDDGTYKLVKILEFRIPYYVGPLNNTTAKKGAENKNSWLVKKVNNVKITPYNFNEVIDLESSAEKFIKRMLGTCTYLLKEPSMPNNSILYSKFKVLNELKQIKVGDENREQRLSKEMINKIYNELFLTTAGTITDKKFKDYLMKTGEFVMYSNLSITGYSADKKFANNMSSYVDFFGENGIFVNTNYTIEDAETIIEYITIFEDKEILKRKVTKEYPELTEEQVKKICRLKYKGWSNLSKKLLTEVYYIDEKTNEPKNILTLMEETSKNFMQIITDKKYNFEEKINKINNNNNSKKLNYELVDELATSPKNKRGIYQALKVLKEIIQYMGYEPKRITIEMARGEEESKRTVDRKKVIENAYTGNSEEIYNYSKLKKELGKIAKIESHNQKLFLYFLQEGKSLYSGTPLNIEELEKYEIDHIIPRTLIKDNSIDNLALVTKEENQNKSASFVLPENYRTSKMKVWWNHLKKLKLMSDKKYNNLIRDKFSQETIEGFINRQLVETRQICKHVANMIKNMYKETEVYYIPANLSSNYREKFELYKFREINDYHHAHDAYLAATLGEYRTNLKSNISYDYLKRINFKSYQEKKYQELNAGYVINSLVNSSDFVELFCDPNTGELLFDADKFNKTIEYTLYQNDILISKKVEFKTGELWQQTKNKKGEKGVPLKRNMPTEKYGAYTSINPAYAAVVKFVKNNKEEQRMIGIPIYIDITSKENKNIKIEYIKNLLNAGEIEIIKDKIPFYSKINWNGAICSLVGATDKVEVCNAKEFNIDKERMKKWKTTLIRLFNKKEEIINDATYNENLEEILKYIVTKIEKEFTLYQNLLDQIKEMFKINSAEKLNVEDKEKAIIEMFKLLKCNSACANLKFLNASSFYGRKEKRIIQHGFIINQSATGLWESYYEF